MELGSFLAKLAVLLSPLLHQQQQQDPGGYDDCSAHAPRRPFTVLVEGNVGSGKSTLLGAFKGRRPDVMVVPEPVAEWQDVNGTDLLGKVLSSGGGHRLVSKIIT